MKPTFAFVMIVGIIWGIKVMIPMFVMTKGGPGATTKTLTMLIYETGIVNWRMGRACALSLISFVAILVLSGLQMRFFGLFREESE